MALVKCTECGNDVSDRAVACPRCGAPPLATRIATAEPTRPLVVGAPARKTSAARIVVAAIALVIAALALFARWSGAGHAMRPAEDVGPGAAVGAPTNSQGAARVHPWTDRADAQITDMLNGETGPVVAQSIQRITHPTAGGASLVGFEVRHVGIALSLRITVRYAGGLGAEHTMTVVWNFNDREHIVARVLSDNSPIPVAAANARQLDSYFRDEIYPTLMSNLRE
jgi:hypothetical protein